MNYVLLIRNVLDVIELLVVFLHFVFEMVILYLKRDDLSPCHKPGIEKNSEFP